MSDDDEPLYVDCEPHGVVGYLGIARTHLLLTWQGHDRS
jgi:hypothetical protein